MSAVRKRDDRVNHWFLGAVRIHEKKLDMLAELLSDIACRLEVAEDTLMRNRAAKEIYLYDSLKHDLPAVKIDSDSFVFNVGLSDLEDAAENK
eukprot:1689172-Karenia_brevis.AAC.1